MGVLIYVHNQLPFLNSSNWKRIQSTTVDGFIFMGTNFRGLYENDTFVGFRIRGYSIFLHNSFRKSLIRGYWNS